MNVDQAKTLTRAIAKSGDVEALDVMMEILRSGEVTGESDPSLILTSRMNKALRMHPDEGVCGTCDQEAPCLTRLALMGKP